MKILITTLFLVLFGCATRVTPPAPVVDGVAEFAVAPSSQSKTVKTSSKASAEANNDVSTPTKITKLAPMASSEDMGQKDTAVEQNTGIKPFGVKKFKVKESAVVADNANDANGFNASMPKDHRVTRDGWIMPVKGNVIGKYSKAKKGVEIRANPGVAINAASDGKVVYSGNGLKGYGNLIIIRHDNGYLTAYALNKVNLVKVGQNVKCGDKIAEVGPGGVLHFELRKDGKPINPDYINGK